MSLLGYLAFLFVAYHILMIVFGFSTYHGYAAWAIPLLCLYSGLCGYAFFRFGFHGFFIYHLGILVVIFWRVWRKQAAQRDVMMELISEADQRELFRLSFASTKGFYWLSAIVHLLVFAVAYLYFLNTALDRLKS